MRPFSLSLAFPITLALLSCSADADGPGRSHPTVASAGNAASSGGTGNTTLNPAGSSGSAAQPHAGSGSTTGGMSSMGGASSGGVSGAQKPLPLPFFVNAPGNFVKSGFMGDAMLTVTAAPSETSPDGTCGGMRAAGKGGGDCDSFKIDPSLAGAEAWQGVFYQFPANNWGTFPGRTIESGATSVTFQARATREVAVMFQIGMCDPADEKKCVDGFYAYPDSADATGKVTVGTAWSEVSVSLAGKDYSSGVHGAFSWSINNDDLLGDTSALDLYLDSITWN